MGVVLEGFDPHIERRVAIKRLHPHLVKDGAQGQFLQRFKQEAQAAARCSHPNIVTILEYGEHDDAPYIVMEYVDGISLQDLLQKRRIKHLKNVISFVGQTLNALHAAHEQTVIHRDIKPANILIMKNGTVKLADFGIARVPVDRELTQAGMAIGTPRYMAPEQAMAQPTDHRADLYALTMLFAQMLAELNLGDSVATEYLPPIEGLSKSHYINYEVPVPVPFIPIIIKGLAFDPEKRIQSTKEYITRLKSAINVVKANAPATSNTSADATRVAPVPTTATVNQTVVDPTELESLQTILSGYLGPIAHNLVKAEAAQHQEPAALARALSAEIPDKEEREAFIRDWENQTGQRAVAPTRTGSAPKRPRARPSAATLSDATRAELTASFAEHVGPLASRLIKMHEGQCRTFIALIDALANEIPDEDDRQLFINRWAHVSA